MDNLSEEELNIMWEQLDEASGNLYEAIGTIERTQNYSKDISRYIDHIDIGLVDGIKREVEKYIEEKKVNN